MTEKLIFEKSEKNRKGYTLPESEIPTKHLEELLPKENLRSKEAKLPEISEPEVMRHFIHLSTMNHHVDKAFYPLGSCTMKYNPKINEDMARLDGFAAAHPYLPDCCTQGSLQLMYELSEYLQEIAGMDAVTLQPAAGAQGEFTGLLLIRAYHTANGNPRQKIIIPDSAHGTNPASARLAGYDTVELASNDRGEVDLNDLEKVMDEEVAGIMLTNPNTLGLFETQILEIQKIIHNKGGLLYMDGANLNAMLGITRPGDMGFDVVHFNLHKTFSTPHGGGGPGSGPVGVKAKLEPYLPVPTIKKEGDRFAFDYDRPESIGKIHEFYGNFGVMVRAYTYIRMLGPKGLKRISKNAIINANYAKARLVSHYDLPHDRHCQHEFVLSGNRQKKQGVKTMDIAKALLDYGVHAPTVYFPLIVDEALMIEPTETESKRSIDRFVDAMIDIAKRAESDPESVKNAPTTTPVRRMDEAKAARNPNVRYTDE
jgi:glycine dehydrogenase subunit 2